MISFFKQKMRTQSYPWESKGINDFILLAFMQLSVTGFFYYDTCKDYNHMKLK